jgi:hypothetical protein
MVWARSKGTGTRKQEVTQTIIGFQSDLKPATTPANHICIHDHYPNLL